MSSFVILIASFVASGIVLFAGWRKVSRSVAQENAVQIDDWERT